MFTLRTKLLGAVVGVILSVSVLADGMLAYDGKVIKKVPTTHKVVSL